MVNTKMPIHSNSIKNDPRLKQMLDDSLNGSSLFRPSPFWQELANKHIQELDDFGFHNFKRTIALKYFTWGMLGMLAQHSVPLGMYFLRNPNTGPFRAKLTIGKTEENLPKAFSVVSGKLYAIFLDLLWQFVKSIDKKNLLSKIQEPTFGNPNLVRRHDGELISQDLCNSIHEFYSITSGLDHPEASFNTVLEIGAGYGRLAQVFLDTDQAKNYWIVDIPPALYVSQRYLSELYPDAKVFSYRPFSKFSEIAEELATCKIAFFSADQISLLPNKSVETVVCISNLHEMTREQISFYYEQIDRICTDYFYTKQWMKSIAKKNGFTIAKGDYPVKPHWSTSMDRRHPIQSWFFETLYRV